MGPLSAADVRFAERVRHATPTRVRTRRGGDDLGFLPLVGIIASVGLQAYQQKLAAKAAKRAEDEARKIEAQQRAAAIAAQQRAAAAAAAQQQQQRALALYQQQRAAAAAAAQLQAQATAPPPAPATRATAGAAAVSQMQAWLPWAAGAVAVVALGFVFLRQR